MGICTTAIAAKKLGRKVIGIDIDAKYVEITTEKLKDVTPTIINGRYVSMFLGKLMTIRSKDWEDIKDKFTIPDNPRELEKTAIQLHVKDINSYLEVTTQ